MKKLPLADVNKKTKKKTNFMAPFMDGVQLPQG